MFSDDDCLYDEDSGNDSPEDEMEDEQEEMDDGEADDFGIDLEPVAAGSGVVKPEGEEEFSFEVRTLDLTIRGGVNALYNVQLLFYPVLHRWCPLRRLSAP